MHFLSLSSHCFPTVTVSSFSVSLSISPCVRDFVSGGWLNLSVVSSILLRLFASGFVRDSVVELDALYLDANAIGKNSELLPVRG